MRTNNQIIFDMDSSSMIRTGSDIDLVLIGNRELIQREKQKIAMRTRQKLFILYIHPIFRNQPFKIVFTIPAFL